MKEEKKEIEQEMNMCEFIMALLSQDDVNGATLIMPGQSIMRIAKERRTEWEP